MQMQLTDVMFAELPRVRLDGAHRTNQFLFDAHPTLCEVPEECEGYMDPEDHFDQQSFQQRLELNTTLNSPLGECTNSIPFELGVDGITNYNHIGIIMPEFPLS